MKTMSQPRIVPVEKSFQQQLNDAIQFIEKHYGLDVQTLAVALAVILLTIGEFRTDRVHGRSAALKMAKKKTNF